MYATQPRRTPEHSAYSQSVALKRYQSIVEAEDWRDLDYESVDPKATKPTKGAIRVNDLLETITGRSGSGPRLALWC
jgi:hypothetical protein